jgi:outer membrane protein W
MKKLMFVVLGIVSFIPLGYAATTGPVETAGKGKFAIGAEGQYVADKNLEPTSIVDLESGETVSAKARVNWAYRLTTNIAYGLTDNLDVYAKLGTTHFKAKAGYTWSNASGDGYEIGNITAKSNDAFTYGFGIKGKSEIKNGWFVGGDAQYLRSTPTLTGSLVWTDFGTWGPDSGVDSGKAKTTVQEWQASVFVGKKIKSFTPYAGVGYADFLLSSKRIYINDAKFKVEAKDNVGIFLGTDYKISKNVVLNVEGRFIDENAISLGGRYIF